MHPRLLIASLALSYAARARAGDAETAQARALDQEGVRAYQDARYQDAIDYFSAAFARGGPSVELWNIARCHLKRDEPEAAARALGDYLGKADLTPEDRDEAQRTREAILARPSPLTITSSPPGARVSIDGKTAGTAPMTLPVHAGAHAIVLERDGSEPIASTTTAAAGRALIVHGDFTRTTPARGGSRVAIEAGLGIAITAYGDATGGASPAGFIAASVPLVDRGRLRFAVGARLAISGDTWSTSAGVSNITGALSCKLPRDYSGATVAGHAVATGGVAVSDELRAFVDVGFGLAGLTTSDVGGDAFMPVCNAATGIAPAAHLALAVSYAVVPRLRLVLRPIALDAQPAFVGARRAPIDASGAWLRATMTAGAAFEF